MVWCVSEQLLTCMFSMSISMCGVDMCDTWFCPLYLENYCNPCLVSIHFIDTGSFFLSILCSMWLHKDIDKVMAVAFKLKLFIYMELAILLYLMTNRCSSIHICFPIVAALETISVFVIVIVTACILTIVQFPLTTSFCLGETVIQPPHGHCTTPGLNVLKICLYSFKLGAILPSCTQSAAASQFTITGI